GGGGVGGGGVGAGGAGVGDGAGVGLGDGAGAADCEIVYSCPPACTFPTRPEPLLFTPTDIRIVPLPFPLAPDVTVIHGTSLAAVQVQPPSVVMSTANVPPADPTVPPAELSEY